MLSSLLWGGEPLSAQTNQPSSILGLWGVEARFGAPVQGELTLRVNGGRWSASIGGYEVDAKANGDAITFTLPGNSGEFRAQLDTATNMIFGEWIQPRGQILNNRYASPVQLRPVSPSTWRGTVSPLEDRISVYASIKATPDGKVIASISNPEMNLFRNRLFAVTRDGTNVHLDAKGWKIDGSYDEKAGILSLELLDGQPPLQLTRRTDSAVGFFSRSPADQGGYRYKKPIPENDGWRTATLAEEGISEVTIQHLIQRILESDPTNNPLDIQSLLIARHGRLVLEEYFYGFDGKRAHDMRSSSKTFAPVLVGLADEHGGKLTPNTLVYPSFPHYKTFENWDVRKKAMTLRDIMTMAAGNACDDNDENSPGNEDKMQEDSKRTDWYKYTLDLPMLRQPGGKNAVYCSGDLNLVGGVVANATGVWLPSFFDQYLARPLQFGTYYLNLMPDGQAYMGGGAYVRPRDELKLGQLFLDGGVWNGKRLLSKTWVEDSTSFHSRFDPRYSLGVEHQYGYGWHINFLNSGGKTYRTLAAGGNGGQFVIIVPDLDLVVGINGGSYGQFSEWYRWELDLIPQFVIPAITMNSVH